MKSVWCSVAQGTARYFILSLTMKAPTAQIIVPSVDIAVCLALLVLFSIITVKSHCCDRQYSRKQRIFLYLLLASLGDSCTYLVYRIQVFSDYLEYINDGFLLLVNVTFCWAAIYVCFEVFITLRRTEFHCLRFRFHTVVEEVCILFIVITITAGWVVVCLDMITHDTLAIVGLPLAILSFIDIVSVVLVLVQLCVAYWRVEDGQVANRLRRPAVVTVTLLVFLVCYVIAFVVLVSFRKVVDRMWFRIIVAVLGYKLIPYMFVIFFGWKMLQDLGRQCCCRRYRRRRGYGQIPGQEERGVPSIQSPVLHLSTTRTYYTCDDVTSTTRTYYTCDESQPPEWFQAVPAPVPPVRALDPQC